MMMNSLITLCAMSILATAYKSDIKIKSDVINSSNPTCKLSSNLCTDTTSLSANQIASSYVSNECGIDCCDIESSYVTAAILLSHEFETKFGFIMKDISFEDTMHDTMDDTIEYRNGHQWQSIVRTSNDKLIEPTHCSLTEIRRQPASFYCNQYDQLHEITNFNAEFKALPGQTDINNACYESEATSNQNFTDGNSACLSQDTTNCVFYMGSTYHLHPEEPTMEAKVKECQSMSPSDFIFLAILLTQSCKTNSVLIYSLYLSKPTEAQQSKDEDYITALTIHCIATSVIIIIFIILCIIHCVRKQPLTEPAPTAIPSFSMDQMEHKEEEAAVLPRSDDESSSAGADNASSSSAEDVFAEFREQQRDKTKLNEMLKKADSGKVLISDPLNQPNTPVVRSILDLKYKKKKNK